MNDEEWNYQDEEFDDSLPYIELQFGPEDLYHVYECVKYRYEQCQVVILMNRKDLSISRIFCIG